MITVSSEKMEMFLEWAKNTIAHGSTTFIIKYDEDVGVRLYPIKNGNLYGLPGLEGWVFVDE